MVTVYATVSDLADDFHMIFMQRQYRLLGQYFSCLTILSTFQSLDL